MYGTEVKSYSLKKDGEMKLTKHFKVKEFACKDGSDTVFIEKKLPIVCEYIRSRCGEEINVNSAYRTTIHNSKVGGAEFSYHLYGMAADLNCPKGYTPSQMASIAEEILCETGGIGIYPWGIHIDTRSTKSRWNG